MQNLTKMKLVTLIFRSVQITFDLQFNKHLAQNTNWKVWNRNNAGKLKSFGFWVEKKKWKSFVFWNIHSRNFIKPRRISLSHNKFHRAPTKFINIKAISFIWKRKTCWWRIIDVAKMNKYVWFHNENQKLAIFSTDFVRGSTPNDASKLWSGGY